MGVSSARKSSPVGAPEGTDEPLPQHRVNYLQSCTHQGVSYESGKRQHT